MRNKRNSFGAGPIVESPADPALLTMREHAERQLRFTKRVQSLAAITCLIGAVVSAWSGNSLWFPLCAGFGLVITALVHLGKGKYDLSALHLLRRVERELSTSHQPESRAAGVNIP